MNHLLLKLHKLRHQMIKMYDLANISAKNAHDQEDTELPFDTLDDIIKIAEDNRLVSQTLLNKVAQLNARQLNPMFHPYTCGNRPLDQHHTDGEGRLVATVDGWICPFCDYKQPFRGE